MEIRTISSGIAIPPNAIKPDAHSSGHNPLKAKYQKGTHKRDGTVGKTPRSDNKSNKRPLQQFQQQQSFWIYRHERDDFTNLSSKKTKEEKENAVCPSGF